MTKSSMSSFSQQQPIDPKILAQWTSKKQDRRTFIVFSVLALFFTIFGLLLVINGANIQEYSVKYSDTQACNREQSCNVQIQVTDRMTGPVYLYYRLDNFFQNHQRYYSSRDDEQLSGVDKPLEKLEKCYPIFTNQDAGISTSITGEPLNPTDPAIPCGLIALTMLKENFTVFGTAEIPVRTTGIAWESDRNGKRFKNVDVRRQWLNMENEGFMNWMRISGLNDFKKLYGIIDQDLEAGTYEITVTKWDSVHTPTRDVSNLNNYDTGRIVILSTVNSFGGTNVLLAVCYLLAAVASLIIWCIFLVRMLKDRKRKRA